MPIEIDLEPEVQKAIEDLEKEVEQEVRDLVIEFLELLMDYTPVDTGLLRNNWNVSLFFPDSRKLPLNNDPVERAKSTLEGYRAGISVYVTNGQDYARIIDEGGPNRPAHMMVERALADIESRHR